MDNNDLDKLFREQLGDFKENPDSQVWYRIRSSLDKKKKNNRIIPFWLRWGAAAAVFAGALILIGPWGETDVITPSITNSDPVENSPELDENRTPLLDNHFPSDPQESSIVNQQPMSGDVESQHVKPTPKRDNQDGEIKSGSGTPDTRGLASAEKKDQQPGIANNSTAIKVPAKNDPEPEASLAGIYPDVSVSRDTRSVVSDNGEKPLEALPVEEEEENLSEGKSIFDAVDEKDALAEQEQSYNKWSVGPSLAPVFFNSFGDGSPIGSNFVANSKSGSVNMSYGIQVSYQLSEKLSMRSGVHRVDYGYNTDEVGFTSSPTASRSSLIRTISYSENSKNLVVQSMVGGDPLQDPMAADVTAPSPAREGSMLQEFGYLEVPLEMQYNLIDKKWGINLIGGMSSLFLVNNSVSLESAGTVTEVGEATNMNSVNFSTNFGLGLYYQLNPKLELNFLPMFKYQLNTFSNTAGSFRPYSVGVYSGLNFKF